MALEKVLCEPVILSQITNLFACNVSAYCTQLVDAISVGV